MATQSEKKSAFRALALASGFLHDAEKLGLTSALLQRLRESPSRMKEFVRLAEAAEAEHVDRIRRLEYERECAVDIDGVHYHVVLITLRDIDGWGCNKNSLISDVVRTAARYRFEPLREESCPTVLTVLETVSPPSQWIGWTDYRGLVSWERTTNGVESGGSYGDAAKLSLSHFPKLSGMVFMQRFIGCEYSPANKGF